VKNEPDDFAVTMFIRMNKREPYGISWRLDRDISVEESQLLFQGVLRVLEASKVNSGPMPERKM
jgi:hypothetical protein